MKKSYGHNLVRIQRDGGIATIVLNRPEKMNALVRPTWEQLRDRFVELSADQTLRCVVLRGAGEKAFSVGADIAEFATQRKNATQARDYGLLMHETLLSIL